MKVSVYLGEALSQITNVTVPWTIDDDQSANWMDRLPVNRRDAFVSFIHVEFTQFARRMVNAFYGLQMP